MAYYKGKKVFSTYYNTRKLFGKVMRTGRIPYAFQEVEYIESSGTQYIDTNLSLPNGFKMEIDIEKTNASFDSACVLGYQNVNSPYQRNWFNINNESSGRRLFLGYGDGSTGVLVPYADLPNRAIYRVSNIYGDRYLVANGVPYNLRPSDDAIYSDENLFLLALHYGANVIQQFKGKIYSCQISNGSQIVRNFVPCYRKADNEVGLYDIINGIFYTNAGTGVFAKGGDI